MLNKCYAKSALVAVNTAEQAVAASGQVVFSTQYISTGSSIGFAAGGSSVTLKNAGLYDITFDADVLAGSATNVTVQLYNNGVAVPGAQATFTGTTTDTVHVHFASKAIVNRSCQCVNNSANLTVVVSAESTVTNAAIGVIKEA